MPSVGWGWSCSRPHSFVLRRFVPARHAGELYRALTFPMLRHPHITTAENSEAPFNVLHLRIPEKPGDSHYTPSAHVALAPALKSGELLRSLPGEEAKTLLTLLAFVTQNGVVQVYASDIAGVLAVSERKARDRLLRLETLVWKGEPLVRTVHIAPGVDAFAPAIHLLAHQHQPEPEANPPLPAFTSTQTHAVSLATPLERAEPVASATTLNTELSNKSGDEDRINAMRDTILRLCAYGISEDEAAHLVATYPLERIERQILWMGYRQARTPARFLIAAIRNDYDAPEYVRHHSAPEQPAHNGTD